jgi:DNA-binding transcriptional regulator YiaG
MITLEEAPRTRVRNSPYDRSTILTLGDQMPFADAAAKVGLGTKDFVTIYRNYGGSRRGGISRRQPPTKSELVQAFKTMTNRQVADYFGVGYKTLVRWLKHYNLQQHVFTNDMLSLSDAARRLNVSRMTLSNWYRKGEIPGAVKVNETRVMVPRATVNMLILLHGQTFADNN